MQEESRRDTRSKTPMLTTAGSARRSRDIISNASQGLYQQKIISKPSSVKCVCGHPAMKNFRKELRSLNHVETPFRLSRPCHVAGVPYHKTNGFRLHSSSNPISILSTLPQHKFTPQLIQTSINRITGDGVFKSADSAVVRSSLRALFLYNTFFPNDRHPEVCQFLDSIGSSELQANGRERA